MERARLVCEAILPQRWRFLRWTFAALLVSGAFLDNTVFAPVPRGSKDGVIHDWCGTGRMMERQEQVERLERERLELDERLERERLLRESEEEPNPPLRLSPECIENPLDPSCRSLDRQLERLRRQAPKPGKPRLIFIGDEPAHTGPVGSGGRRRAGGRSPGP